MQIEVVVAGRSPKNPSAPSRRRMSGSRSGNLHLFLQMLLLLHRSMKEAAAALEIRGMSNGIAREL